MSIARVATLEDCNTDNRWSPSHDDQTCSISTSSPIQTFCGASFATRTEMSRNCFGLRTELRTSRHPGASGMGRLAWGADSSHPTCDGAWRSHLVTLWKRRLETCIYLTGSHWFIIGSRDPIIRPSSITWHRSHDVTRYKTELLKWTKSCDRSALAAHSTLPLYCNSDSTYTLIQARSY